MGFKKLSPLFQLLNFNSTFSLHFVTFQVSTLFLQWLPWALRMTRPGVKITKKSIMMGKKMRELEAKEIGSKSVLSGALDMEDDFRGSVSAGHFGGPPSKTGYVNLVAKVARVTIK